jgi:hypothetical protein
MQAPPPEWDVILVVFGIEKVYRTARAREILAPVAYMNNFFKAIRTLLSWQLRIARIALLALLVTPYRAKPSTATGFLAPTTGR